MWLSVSLFGIYHWLFSLEYYFNSRVILRKLSGIYPTEAQIRFKWLLFWSVTIVFLLLEAGACYLQIGIIARDSQNGLIGVNEVPDTVMVALDLISCGLLVKAIS